MQRLILTLWLGLLGTSGVSAAAIEKTKICSEPPFEEGELTRFVAKVGILKVGEGIGILQKARAPIPEVALLGPAPDSKMWHFRGSVFSTGVVAAFYTVDDTLEVWMDSESLAPHRLEARIHETNERSAWRVLYDHKGGLTHSWRDRSFYRKNRERETVTVRENQLVAGSFEPLSLFFYLRCADMRLGEELEIPLHENGKNRRVRILAETIETLDTAFGEIEALRAEVKVFLGGKLQNKRPFTVWVSNDRRRLPLRFSADLKFADLKGVLVGYRKNYEAKTEGEFPAQLLKAVAQDFLSELR